MDPVFRRAIKFGYVHNDKAHPVFEAEKKAAKKHADGSCPFFVVLNLASPSNENYASLLNTL